MPCVRVNGVRTGVVRREEVRRRGRGVAQTKKELNSLSSLYVTHPEKKAPRVMEMILKRLGTRGAA